MERRFTPLISVVQFLASVSINADNALNDTAILAGAYGGLIVIVYLCLLLALNIAQQWARFWSWVGRRCSPCQLLWTDTRFWCCVGLSWPRMLVLIHPGWIVTNLGSPCLRMGRRR